MKDERANLMQERLKFEKEKKQMIDDFNAEKAKWLEDKNKVKKCTNQKVALSI